MSTTPTSTRISTLSTFSRSDRKDSSAIVHDRKKAYTIPPYDDIVYIPLHDRYVRENQLPCDRYLLPPGLRSDSIYKVYKKNWNEDNFGPVKVPRGNGSSSATIVVIPSIRATSVLLTNPP